MCESVVRARVVDVSVGKGAGLRRLGAGGRAVSSGGHRGGDDSAKHGFGAGSSRKSCDDCHQKCYQGLANVAAGLGTYVAPL